jgi:hypothetical protein
MNQTTGCSHLHRLAAELKLIEQSIRCCPQHWSIASEKRSPTVTLMKLINSLKALHILGLSVWQSIVAWVICVGVYIQCARFVIWAITYHQK